MARIIGEGGGAIRVGRCSIVMENAVVRQRPRHSCLIGDHCLIVPNAHVTGAELENQVFVATGAAIFHGARVGHGSEVRVHATVHLRTRLDPGTTVPIGWAAVGERAGVAKFRDWVYGFDRATPDLMRYVIERLSDTLGAHESDTVLGS